jgi:hypothetical protein
LNIVQWVPKRWTAPNKALGPSLRRELTTIRYGLSLQKPLVTTCLDFKNEGEGNHKQLFSIFYEKIEFLKLKLIKISEKGVTSGRDECAR